MYSKRFIYFVQKEVLANHNYERKAERLLFTSVPKRGFGTKKMKREVYDSSQMDYN